MRFSPPGTFSVRSAYRALFRAPGLVGRPFVESAYPSQDKDFCVAAASGPPPFGGGGSQAKQVGQCLVAVVCGTLHIMFSCPAALFLWIFLHEALGPEWKALDHGGSGEPDWT
jgi:hypothetical protein